MKRPLSVRTLASLLAGAGLWAFACSEQAHKDSATIPIEQAAKNFCGNGRCDHGETCSTCSQDCGSCGTDAGGSTGVCGSTGSPPAQYQHVVIFSFENRTWSNVGLGFSATT